MSEGNGQSPESNGKKKPGNKKGQGGKHGRYALVKTRERAAWDLSVDGYTLEGIVAELEKRGLGKVSPQAVSLMLRRVWEPQLRELKIKVLQEKMRQEDALLKLYREALQAWEASKKPQRTLVNNGGSDSGDGAGSGNKVTISVRDSAGDVRFLTEARGSLADLRKLWGADAAFKIDLSGLIKAGEESEFERARRSSFATWTAAELEQLARLEASVQERQEKAKPVLLLPTSGNGEDHDD